MQQDVRRHDAFRQDTSSTANSLKPSGQQSLGDKVEQKTDQTQFEVQPDETKSVSQQTRDYVTPGNDSAGAVGSCTKSGTRSLVTAVKTPTSIRLNDSKAKC